MNKYARTASELLPFLGGADNVNAVTHCVTRIRISLADPHTVDTIALRGHPAVLGQLDRPNTYHVIVGPAVAEPLAHAIYNAVTHQADPT